MERALVGRVNRQQTPMSRWIQTIQLAVARFYINPTAPEQAAAFLREAAID